MKICFFILMLFKIIKCYYIPEGHHNKTLNNISFGSCYEGFLADRYDIFKSVLNERPEMWVWLGDATYLDNITYNYFKYEKDFSEIWVENMFDRTTNEKCNNLIN